MKEHCNIAAIFLTQDQVAIVDIADYEELNQYKWCARKVNNKYKTTYYAVRSKRLGIINGEKRVKFFQMPRETINAKKNFVVDHVNGNPLDNRRKNLKEVTVRQNCQNRHHEKTSKYPGVSWNKRDKKWVAQIEINGNKITIKSCLDEHQAYKAYLNKCKELEL